MKGNNNKFLTGGFTMKQICKIYSSTISFVRAFERAAGVVVLSTTLMFNCATTKSADTSSRYVAESTTTSRSADSKEVINTLDKIKKINDAESELIKKSLYHMEEAEKAAKIEEQARQEKEQARQEKEQALEKAKKQCINVRKMLEEAKYWCDQGYSEFCKVYKEQSAGYDTDCEKKYGK
jgi:hypothetical protein